MWSWGRSRDWPGTLAFLAASCAIALGASIQLGWLLDLPLLIQWHPGFTPTLPHSGFCLILAGIALGGLAHGRSRFGWFVLLPIFYSLGLLILKLAGAEAAFSPFWSWTLLGRYANGGMTYVVATSFILLGTALLLLRPVPGRKRVVLAAAAASIVLALAVPVLLSNIGGLDIPRRYFFAMGMPSALGLLLLGLGVLALAWRVETELGMRTPRWLPLTTGIGLAVMAVVFWYAAVLDQQKQLRFATRIAAERTRDHLRSRMFALSTALWWAAMRWEQAEDRPADPSVFQAQIRERGLSGLITFQRLDPKLAIAWTVPAQQSTVLRTPDGQPIAALQRLIEATRLRRRATFSEPIPLETGGSGLAAAVPILTDGEFSGWGLGVFQSGPLLDSLLGDSFLAGYGIGIFAGKDQLYFRGDAEHLPTYAVGQTAFESYNVTWDIQAWPEATLLAERRSHLPTAILVGGLLTALLVTAVIYLAQVAQARALEARANARALEEDLIERRRAEQALRNSEARYRAVVESTADGIFINKGGRIVYANSALQRLLGAASPDMILGRSYLDFIHADYHPIVQTRISSIFASRQAVPFLEMKYIRLDGSIVEVESAGTAFDVDGETAILVTLRDLTQRKEAEAALQREREFIRLVLDTDPNLIFVKDAAGRFVLVNKALADLYSSTPQCLIGQQPGENLPGPNELPEYRQIELEVLRTGQPIVVDETNTRPDGKVFQFHTIKVPLVLKDGTTHVLCIATDVTEQRHIEDQLRQAQKMEAVGRLAGGVAHDFNNLLTIISGYSEILLNHLARTDPLAQTMVREIKNAGDRAAALTRQLLAFSRKSMLKPSTLDVNVLVQDMGKMLRRLLEERIVLETRLEKQACFVHADPSQLEQAVINLAVNAQDAMPQGGHLTIETSLVDQTEDIAGIPAGRYVCLSIHDTGEGMDQLTQARIFEPFFTTKDVGKGTGLGLAMVYGFVKQSGGYITVESSPGAGATFRVFLPHQVTIPGPAPLDAEAMAIPRGQETILLAEDQAEVRILTRRVLQQFGYTVLEASNGYEAIEVGNRYQGPIHLLVTDVVMPRLGGRQAAESLRTRHPETRVLFLSGYTDDALVRHGVAKEHTAFLQKPFKPAVLAAKIREVLDLPQSARV